MFTTLHSFEALHELTQAYYAIKFHFHDKQLKSWRFISYFFREVTTIIIEQHDEILMSFDAKFDKNRSKKSCASHSYTSTILSVPLPLKFSLKIFSYYAYAYSNLLMIYLHTWIEWSYKSIYSNSHNLRIR